MIKMKKMLNEYGGKEDTILTYPPTSDRSVGYVLFTFGSKRPIDADYILNLKGDGWFRRPDHKKGAGYGLAIRDIKIDKNNLHKDFLDSNFNVYKCNVTFLPSSEDEDNRSKYERGSGWLWVHKKFNIDEVEKYINYNKKLWVP